MRAHELTVGRTFGVTFDHGEDFFEAPSTFCRDNGVRQGYGECREGRSAAKASQRGERRR